MSSYYNQETHNVEHDDCDQLDDFDYEPCEHDCDESGCDEDYCTHSHCMNCGGCQCPGYCDDHQTYNLRPPAETGGAQ